MDENRWNLWQVINKQHMEANTKETITDEEWELFCIIYKTPFANEVSQLAIDFWNDRDLNGMSRVEYNG